MVSVSFVLCLLFLEASSASLPAKFDKRSVPIIYTISSAQWNKLNNSVGGRLAKGQPLAAPCYSLYNSSVVTPNVTQCSNIQQNYATDLFVAGYYGGYMQPNWGACQANGESCALDRSDPSDPTVYAPPNECYQGSVSPYYIAVQKVSDIQAALAFSKSTGTPLAIKNSGHDYKGRSAAPNSLALWTHTLISGPTLQKNFIPEGCTKSVGPGITFGAGHNFNDMYSFADANNVTVVGGSSRTVGIGGGWIIGGGHSALSNTLGLGVDNVLQIRGVLPNGTYVTANECQNSDLWFAWRGGGGSTFGINVEMTTRAHPRLTLQVVYVRFLSPNATSAQQLTNICIENAAKWASEGWGGYIAPGAMTDLASGLILITPQLSLSEAVASMEPITSFAASLGQVPLNNSVKTVQSFYQFFENYILPNQETVSIGLAVGSRLVPAAQFETASGRQALLTAITNMSKLVQFPADALNPLLLTYGAPLQILVTAPSSYPVSAVNDTSSITPAWRNATWHVVAGEAFSNQATAAQIITAFHTASAAADQLRNLPLTTGAYQNEADTFEPNPAATFWGMPNYQRLLKIKQQLDPGNLLTCHQCIGWTASDSRYGCYPDV